MKKMIFAAAVVAAPAQAYAADGNVLDGFVSAAVGYQDSGASEDFSEVDSGDDITFALRGTVAVPLSTSIGLQADVAYAREPLNYPAPYETSLKTTTAAAHLFYRNEGNFLLGVIGQTNFNTISVYTQNIDTKQYFLGGEGQVHLNNVTLTGQVAYRNDEVSYYDDVSFDGVAATAEVKYFIDSNWSLALKGEYSNVGFEEDFDIDQWRIGLGTERRLSSLPVSIFANVNYGETKFQDEDFKFHDTRLMVGVKFNFGSGSLAERNRSGASLEPFRAESPLLFFGGLD